MSEAILAAVAIIAASGFLILSLFGFLPILAFLAGVFLASPRRPLKRFSFLVQNLAVYLVTIAGFWFLLWVSIMSMGFGMPVLFGFLCLVIFWHGRIMTRRALDAEVGRGLVVIYGLLLTCSIPLNLSLIGWIFGVPMFLLASAIWLYLLFKPSAYR